MAQKIMKGKFITFEGSEGSGKSTQSKLLCSYLKKKGRGVIFIREPGATKIGEKIREVLLDAKNKSMHPGCETLLYMAARAQLVAQIILPALKRGTIVVCDRFLDSTLAYQGYGLGVDIKAIKCIGDFAACGLKPDLTIFLDLPVAQGLLHRASRKDRIEQRSLKYHNAVRNGYLKIAQEEPKRFKIVKVDDHKLKTQSKIRELVENVI
jgi:dTMP kinase